MVCKIAFGLFFWSSDTATFKIVPADCTKKARSSSLHLLVSWARRIFSEANSSSRSNSSSGGGGSSRNDGGNTCAKNHIIIQFHESQRTRSSKRSVVDVKTNTYCNF